MNHEQDQRLSERKGRMLDAIVEAGRAAEGYRQSVIVRAYEESNPITLAPMGGE